MVNEVGLKVDILAVCMQHQWHPYMESEFCGEEKRGKT